MLLFRNYSCYFTQIIMTQSKISHLIFDFDGTLVDSFTVTMQKLSLLTDQLGFKKINLQEIEHLKDLTSHELIRYLNIPLHKIPLVLYQGRKHMQEVMPTLPIFADLPEVLTKLHALNCKLGIVTSNSADNVNTWLQRQKIQHLFHFIRAESSFFGKDKILKNIVKTYEMEPLHTFYIGDETRDIEAAQKSRIQDLAVTWGFHSQKALAQAKPKHMAHHPQDLLTILKPKIEGV